MERLNEIMVRTSQRRPPAADQRTQQAAASQGQRPAQPAPRRPIPEQTSRLGQQPTRTSQQRASTSQYNQRPLPPRSRDEQDSDLSAQSSRSAFVPRQRPAVSRSGGHQQLRPRPLPEPPLARPRQTDEDYYGPDEYVPGVQADVVEEWEEEAVGMRYGDWESDENEAQMYQRASVEPPDHLLATREMPAIPPLETRRYVTRNLRDVAPPAPTTRPPVQEPRAYQHRVTQPLRPHLHAGANYEAAPEVVQRATRQIVRDKLDVYPAPAMAPMPALKGVCSRCRGAGYLRENVPYGHPNFGKAVACECKVADLKEKRRQQLRGLSNLDAFHDKSFRTFNSRAPGVQRAFQSALEFVQNPDGWLLLVGPNGCGKTHLAAAVANLSLEGGSLVLFATVPDLLDHLRAAFAPASDEIYDQLFARMREAELLVLDDLGAQQSSPWANEKLFQLLNYRYNSRFPTVITANNKGLQSIDERIRSRLTDSSLVVSVAMDGAQDYRPRNPRRE